MKPWCIWTRQRCASIALMEALKPVTTFPVAESECFDGTIERRQFSHVRQPGQLLSLCSEHWSFKHCYDRLSLNFNIHLAQATNAAEYRHIHLLRKDEFARLVSLGVAENEITWVKGSDLTNTAFRAIQTGTRTMKPLNIPSLIRRGLAADRQWTEITRHLSNWLVLWTENITGPAAIRRQAVHTLLAHLEISSTNAGSILRHLQYSGQDGYRLWPYIPNLSEFRTAYSEAF